VVFDFDVQSLPVNSRAPVIIGNDVHVEHEDVSSEHAVRGLRVRCGPKIK
jgi:hypothetical protein